MKALNWSTIASLLTSIVSYILYSNILVSIITLVATFILSFAIYYFVFGISDLYKKRKTFSSNDFGHYGQIMIGIVVLGILGNLSADLIMDVIKEMPIFQSILLYLAILLLFITTDIGLWFFRLLTGKYNKKKKGQSRGRRTSRRR